MFNGRIEPQRAAAIGKLLFSKYDYDRKGYIDKNQCYSIFADNVYRIMVCLEIFRDYKTHLLMKIVIQCMLFLTIIEIIEYQLKILKH
jgi:hypothetical protein